MKLTLNSIYFLLLSGLFVAMNSCNGQNIKSESKITVQDHDSSDSQIRIQSIFQDSKGNYWFGTNRNGIYYYDGSGFTSYSKKDGLVDNQIRSIQEDQSGNIYFGTGGRNGAISRFDGKSFTTLTDHIKPNGEWKIGANDLWFAAGNTNGIYRYDGNSLFLLQLPETKLGDAYHLKYPNSTIIPYGIYSIFKDSKGHIWFGTESLGVCRYDGNSFTWFTEQGLANTAIRSIYEDKNGDFWFGSSGLGVIHYDGKNFRNFSEDHRIANAEFIKVFNHKTAVPLKELDKEETLASIISINGDKAGNLWMSTTDSGLWQYDGTLLLR